jgi:DNA-binding NarL/FixJ family response regulator
VSSGLSRSAAKIGEIQEVSARDVCDDLRVAKTVLVVDDHAGFRRSVRRLLQSAGFLVVDEAADGASAVAAVADLRPDVVLLDVLLPDASGFDVAESLASAPDRPIVVLTSSRSASDFRESLARSSARGFIAKRDLTAAALAALVGEAA